MREEKPNYYAVIPATVRYDNRLKPNEKLLYGEISALSNKYGECFATNSYFSELYETSKETASRWISHLVELKYITIDFTYKNESKEIDKRIIKIGTLPIDKKINTYCQNNQEGIDKKIKDNNTSINNISTSSSIEEKNLFDFIQENFGRTLAPIEYEEIKTWEDNELTRYAIKQAVLNGKYGIKYISKILYEYQKNNVTTVQQAQQREFDYQKQKETRKNLNYKHYKTQREREEEAIAKFLSEPDD